MSLHLLRTDVRRPRFVAEAYAYRLCPEHPGHEARGRRQPQLSRSHPAAQYYGVYWKVEDN